MAVLAPHLPNQYSPLRANGHGLQSVYLTNLPETFAGALVDILGAEARAIVARYRVTEEAPIQPAIGLLQWEQHEMDRVRKDEQVSQTTREAVVMARRGQGLFKQRVMSLERSCRITGVDLEEHLRASH